MNIEQLIEVLNKLKANLEDSKESYVLLGERDANGDIVAKQVDAFFLTKMADNNDFIFLLTKEEDRSYSIKNEEMEKSEKVRKETLDLSKRTEH